MILLLVISELFSRVVMDIVGPLPRSCSGNKYILVLRDYVTKYPETLPLKNIDAEIITKELVTLFAQVRIPYEILTDQGPNIQSQLLRELYCLLQIRALIWM